MKKFLTQFGKSLHSSVRRVSLLHRSMLASMLVHIGVFFILAIILSLMRVQGAFKPPEVLSFVFLPTEIHDESGLAGVDVTQGQAAEQPETTPGEAKPEQQQNPPRPSTASPQSDEEPKEAEPAHAVDETPNSDQGEMRLPLEERFKLNADDAAALARSRLELDRSRVRAPKIDIPKRQEKMLQKRFRKWTEDFHKMELPDSALDWQHQGKTYTAKFQQIPAAKSTGIDEVLVEIEMREGGMTHSTKMRMQRLAFSHFAQFVDYWDPNVALHDDHMDGRFHSNTEILLSSWGGVNPKFYGKVTTASYDIRAAGGWPLTSRENIFMGGLEVGVKAIRLPRDLLFLAADSASGHQHRFYEEAWITFNADGSYTWTTKNSPSPRTSNFRHESFYFLGGEKAKLHVKGVVKGKVLVYSQDKVIIDGNLTYTRHPDVARNAEDYLGLVSDKDIEIAHPDVTGPGDLSIFGAVCARKRFRVRHLHGDGEATLYIYGSLTAGSISATEPRYATHIRFDKRLEHIRPPSFPMSNRYEVQDWDGKWEVKKTTAAQPQ